MAISLKGLNYSLKLINVRQSHFRSQSVEDLLSNGVFAVNKPKYMRSSEAVRKIKTAVAMGISYDGRDSLKVGHGGVLDETASGVLAIGVFQGCKILPRFLHGVKQYVVTGQLGVSTCTLNETGKVTREMSYAHVTKKDIVRALKKFHGKILQIPPVYSALKLGGKRYSDLAREGYTELRPKARTVSCYSVTCTLFDPPFFNLLVKCGGGFYVRSLIDDLGKDLNCCAHVRELHRIQHGVFKEPDALTEDSWTVVNILNSIQKAKKKYNHLFNRTIPPVEKNIQMPVKKKNTVLLMENDLFDL